MDLEAEARAVAAEARAQQQRERRLKHRTKLLEECEKAIRDATGRSKSVAAAVEAYVAGQVSADVLFSNLKALGYSEGAARLTAEKAYASKQRRQFGAIRRANAP